MKIAYHAPRPVFVDSGIDIHDCTQQYGNPQGYSFYIATFVFAIYLDYYFSDMSFFSSSNKIIFGIATAFGLFIIGITGYAIVYVGAHSIDQVLLGWGMGIWLALFMHKCFKPYIFDHVDTLLTSPATPTAVSRQINIAVGSMSIFMLLLLASNVYLIVEKNFAIPNTWVTNLSAGCTYVVTIKEFSGISLLTCGWVVVCIGAYIGIQFESAYLDGQTNYDQSNSILKGFGRMLVMLVLFVPFMLPSV